MFCRCRSRLGAGHQARSRKFCVAPSIGRSLNFDSPSLTLPLMAFLANIWRPMFRVLVVVVAHHTADLTSSLAIWCLTRAVITHDICASSLLKYFARVEVRNHTVPDDDCLYGTV